jgi:hypothetical protein
MKRKNQIASVANKEVIFLDFAGVANKGLNQIFLASVENK